MATGGREICSAHDRDETKEWQQIEEQITCLICGNLFIDPKTIPCLHTFCKRCIEKRVKLQTTDSIKSGCPLCLSPISRDQIASIPINVTIRCLLQIFKSRENTRPGLVAVECGKCEEASSPIVTWCLNCQTGLCQSCDQVHSKWKEFKSHKTVVIKEFTQYPKKMLPRIPPKSKNCKTHTKQQLQLYCSTCLKLVCQDCVLESHLEHEFSLAGEDSTTMDHVITPLKMMSERMKNYSKAMKESKETTAIRAPLLCVGRFDFVTTDNNEINFKKGDILEIVDNEGDWWYARAKQSGQMGYVPSNYLIEYNIQDIDQWFFEALTLQDAKRLLMKPGNDTGSFLVHSCNDDPGRLSLAVRDKDKVQHYEIRCLDDRGYFIDHRMRFETLEQLVEYYSTQEGCLSTQLKMPCIEEGSCLEVEKSSICLVSKLGAGQFGEVWQGVWNDTTPVAVKTIKSGVANPTDFLQEAALMRELHHPNLLQLYGVCTREEPIYIITELMKQGSLLEYLRGDGCSLMLPQLIDMGAQVAAGMAYLELNNYIHRDLAARNILVSDQDDKSEGNLMVCKVADFGLARVIDEDIYEAHTGAKFPIKWTALEAALFGHFSVKSDVWSFGILLYELITHGSCPYPTMSNAQVLEALQTGYRMPRPMGCPEQLYEIMSSCWLEHAQCRPTFETLHWELDEYFVEEELIISKV